MLTSAAVDSLTPSLFHADERRLRRLSPPLALHSLPGLRCGRQPGILRPQSVSASASKQASPSNKRSKIFGSESLGQYSVAPLFSNNWASARCLRLLPLSQSHSCSSYFLAACSCMAAPQPWTAEPEPALRRLPEASAVV